MLRHFRTTASGSTGTGAVGDTVPTHDACPPTRTTSRDRATAAGDPLASSARSAPRPPVSDFASSTTSPGVAVWAAPNRLASDNRLSLTSHAITRHLAPAAIA